MSGDAADLIITNATVVVCDDAMTVIEGGGVAVSGGAIVNVGDDAALEARRTDGATVIDAGGRILMPGLVNTHCHSGNSLYRGLVEGLPLEPWLAKLWVAETAITSPETVGLGARLGYAENLLNGVTAVMDMYWHPEELVAAAEETGLRVATGAIFFDPPGIDGATADKREAMGRGFFDAHKDHPHLIKTVCPHGAYTVSPESLERVRAVQEDYDALLTIHAAETRAEQADIKERYGASVIRHLDSLSLLSPKTVLAHCVHLDDEEIDILARTGATVSHNPASNLKLGSGIARVPDFISANVRVALGTDGAVSGNDLDLWKAIRLAAILHNGAREDAAAVSARDAVLMATLRGAEALGVADEAGSLEVGKRADFILMNPDQAHAAPVFDPVSYLAYAASHHDVEDVFIAGRQVVDNRRLTTLDLGAVIAGANALIPRLKASLAEA
ncbi:MAG: amidohydrolase [Pseudomonadota bacterium]